MSQAVRDPSARTAPAPAAGDGGRLAENIMQFARVLRRAGLPVGPGKVLDAIDAVTAAGLGSRADFYWTLHAVFVNRRDQREVFDQAFHVFWRNPQLLERMLSLVLPAMRGEDEAAAPDPVSQRVAEAFSPETQGDSPAAEEGETEVELDMALTFSGAEKLQAKDFEQMTTAELAQAKRAIARLAMPLAEIRTRRYRPDARGARADMRATLRAAARGGAGRIELKRRSPRTRRRPLVILCDISGSMDRYARMLLHFVHALTNDRDRVHTFLFGTRLTNVTRHLRDKDPDVALAKISEAVADWAGGTRIGACLKDFNRHWSRRVLGQGAEVLLITDGLDRDGAAGLEAEVERLAKSASRLVWLNPLLRWEGFEPKAQGCRALIRHVDDFLPVHNLNSLTELAQALSAEPRSAAQRMRQWRRLAA